MLLSGVICLYRQSIFPPMKKTILLTGLLGLCGFQLHAVDLYVRNTYPLALAINAVPEPSTYALLGLGG